MEETPKVLNIRAEYMSDIQLDFSTLANLEHKERITKMVSNYIPKQMYESNLKIQL